MEDDMEQMISLVTGPLGTTSSRLWNKIYNKMDKKSTGKDIKRFFDEKIPKKKEDKLYDMFLKPAIQNNLFSSTVSKLNVDWISEAQDKDVVFVLCLDFVPEKFKFFVMAYILKKIFHLVKNNKIHKKNLAIFREASLFMKVVDSDKSKEETTQIFRNIITDVARYCRSGLFLSLDSQDSAEVRGMIEGAEDFLFVSEMPSPRSRETTLDPLKQDKRISPAQISYIGWKIKIHEVCVVERGQRAKILKRIHPPRCRYWKSEYGDFFSLWRKEINKWKDTRDFLEVIEREEEERDIFRKAAEVELKEEKYQEEKDKPEFEEKIIKEVITKEVELIEEDKKEEKEDEKRYEKQYEAPDTEFNWN